jgi:uncharacterized protein (TIRG00374 family)
MELASSSRVRVARIRGVVLRTALGVSVSALLIVAFLRLVDVSALVGHLADISIGFAVLSGVVFLSAYVVRALRWRFLLRPCEVSVGRVVAIYQVGTFLNWLLPVRGGEVAMSILLRRSNAIPVSRSLAAVTMDKGLDLLSVLALIAVLPFMRLRLSGALWSLLVLALALVAFAAFVIALAAFRRERARALLARPVSAVLPRSVRQRVESFVGQFVDALVGLIRRPRVLAVAGGLTAVALSLDALFCLLAFRAVGVDTGILVALYGYTLYNLSFILPSPPGQIGSNELVGLLIFSGAFGINRSAVGAMFVFSHPWTAALMTISGLVCLSLIGSSLRSTLRLAGNAPGDKQ